MGWKERQAARDRLAGKKKEKKDDFHINPYIFDPTTRYTLKCVVKESYTTKKGYHMWKIYFIIGDTEKGIIFYDRPWSPVYSFRIGQYYEANILNGKPFLQILNIIHLPRKPNVSEVNSYKRALWLADLEVINEELLCPS